LRQRLCESGIPLRITYGADVHLSPDLAVGLVSQTIPSLNGGRYFLLEPPHHIAPPRLKESVFALITAGYVPVITHPERLAWIQDHYGVFHDLVRAGAWMQVTAGSLIGRFGSAARYWGERFLDEGLTHILATDAHGVGGRPPVLSEGLHLAERWVGGEVALNLVKTRPWGILEDIDPASLPPLPGVKSRFSWRADKPGWFGGLFTRWRVGGRLFG
jgi:protein-tyrosine phosphatase